MIISGRKKIETGIFKGKSKLIGRIKKWITGIIFTSLAIPASVSGTSLLWNLAPGFSYTLTLLAPILFLLPFLGLGIPFIVVGFIKYRKHRYQKYPNPFLSDNFEHNKIKVKEYAVINSNMIRNKVAGYITRYLASQKEGRLRRPISE